MAGEITVLQLQNAALDAETIAEVAMVGYTSDTTTNRDGDVVNTLQGQLKLLGYIPPVTYAGAISFGANDRTKTVIRNGITYSPIVTALPFTTSGTWAADDELKFQVIPQGSSDYYTDSGTTNTFVLTPGSNTIPPTGYYEGMEVTFNPNSDNTGACTIDVNGLGVKDIKDRWTGAGALVAGEIVKATSSSESLTTLVYNGTYFAPKQLSINLLAGTGIYWPSGRLDAERITHSDSGNSFTFNWTTTSTPTLVISSVSATQGNTWNKTTSASSDTFYMTGSTSGSITAIRYQDKTSGYIATINATSVQQKVFEWDNVALKATKAFELPTYANLAAISAAITAPRAGMLVYVTGQGMAIYKASWVRTTDETTAIT